MDNQGDPGQHEMPPSAWHMEIFRKSVIKQAKWRALEDLLGEVKGCRGLDLGADNGVISFLLREKGGEWHSADLDPAAVESIRGLVGERVHRIDGRSLPFGEAELDLVVIVDMLEHLQDDEALVREIARVLRPGGRLIANVPHAKRGAVLRPVRNVLGLTDAWHGHVRPGYTVDSLRRLLGDRFTISRHRTYNRFFSEALDIALNCAYERKRRGGDTGTKGAIVTGTEMDRHRKSFRLYSRLYPLMRLFASLDLLARPFSGYSLIVSASRTEPEPTGGR